jgi:two-component system cell cycle response regulator CpdR
MWEKMDKSGGEMKAGGVLIVDDEPYLLDLAASFFKCEGVEACCAADGEEAIRKLREKTFIIMVTDFNMPGMDGIELAGKAREIAPHMPIIMITANISQEIHRQAKEAGIAEVFCKPFDLDEILAMVKKKMAEEKNHASFGC